MLFLNLELALFSVMANAITHPTDKVLKMNGGLYGKRKKREDWVDGIGGLEKEISRYIVSLYM